MREQKGGKSSLKFSYRVVAKRKDIQGSRLEKVRILGGIEATKAAEEAQARRI